MKMIVRIVSWIVIVNLAIFVDSLKRDIAIGGVFGPDEVQEQIAFKAALERAGMFSPKLQYSTSIVSTSRDDPFKVSRAACELGASGVAAILAPAPAASVAAKLEIPTIHLDWEYPDEKFSPMNRMTLNFYPDSLTFSSALAALVSDYDWTAFTVLYENDEGLIRLQEVFKMHGPDSKPITVRQLERGGDNRMLLKGIKNAGETRIILDCETERILDYLRQAHEVKLFEDYQSYILTSLDAHTVDYAELRYSLANVTSIRMFDPDDADLKAVTRDWRQNGWRGRHAHLRTVLASDAATHIASALNDLSENLSLRTRPLTCNRTKTWEDGYSVISYMKKPTKGLTGLIEFDDYGRRSNFELQIVEQSKSGFKQIATWSSNGFTYTRSEGEASVQLAERWQNKTFVVSSRIGAPYLMMKQPVNGEELIGNDRYEGYSMDLIDGISKILNLSYEFELVPDGNYGSLNKVTGEWDGLVKRLLDGKADLAICDLTITFDRRSAVDFTMPFLTTGISILYRKPIKEPPNIFSFLEPLSVEVWMYTATSVLAISLLILLMARMAPADWVNPNPSDKRPQELENIWEIRNCFWVTMGSLMQQGCDILPKGISSRWVTGVFWFFALILISSYTANMAAFLTNERISSPINGAEDLAAQAKIKYGTVAGGSTQVFFRESNYSIYNRMWTAMESAKPSVFTKNNDEGLDRVIKGKGLFAFMMESTSIEYIMERNCDVSQIGGQLDSKGYGIAMPTNSPYRTVISGAVLKMQESGDLSKLKKKWWEEMNGGGSCEGLQSDQDGAEAAELKMGNVGGVFLVLGCGCTFAIIIAVFEFMWNVRTIAIEENIRKRDVLRAEVLFTLNLAEKSKPVRHTGHSHSTKSSSTTEACNNKRMTSASIMKAASSFINLDKVY